MTLADSRTRAYAPIKATLAAGVNGEKNAISCSFFSSNGNTRVPSGNLFFSQKRRVRTRARENNKQPGVF